MLPQEEGGGLLAFRGEQATSRRDQTGTLTGPSSPRPVLTGGSCATLSWVSKWARGRGAIRQDLPGEVRPAASAPAVPGRGLGPLAPPRATHAGLGQCSGRRREAGGTPRLCLFRDRALSSHLPTLRHDWAAPVALVLTPAGRPRPPSPVTLRRQELSAPLCRGGPGAMTGVKRTGCACEGRGAATARQPAVGVVSRCTKSWVTEGYGR